MIMVWGSCLVITLLSVSWVVRRVVQPLDQLNASRSATKPSMVCKTTRFR